MADTHNDTRASITDERAPLLSETGTRTTRASSPSPSAGPSASLPTPTDPAGSSPATPLPVRQVALLCLSRTIEAVAFFTIFPFINAMLHDIAGVPSEEVGFWSGLIESVFSFMEMIVMLFWGGLSDSLGRKPVLLFCLLGLALAMAAFGLAQTVWSMVALRAAAGVFGGTLVTVRTMLSESTDPSNQARAFSFFAFSFTPASFIGSIIGGALSNPSTQYPSVFKGVWFFEAYPYVLPGIVAGGLCALLAGADALWLEETQPDFKYPLTDTESSPASTIAISSQSGTSTPSTVTPDDRSWDVWRVMRSPGVMSTISMNMYMGGMAFVYAAIVPVFYFTPVPLGGLGFSPARISVFMASQGVANAVWVLLVFPPLHKRIGTNATLRTCALVWPVSFTLMPMLNVALRLGYTRLFWALVPVAVFVPACTAMGFAAAQLALNASSPHPRAFGTLNGLALSLQSGVRAISPALGSSIYAWGVSNMILGGHFGWVVFFALSLVAGPLLFHDRLPSQQGDPSPVLKSAENNAGEVS